MPTLIGRDRELAVIQGSLANAAEGRGSSVLVRGDPGIGKSALLELAAEQAGQEGFSVLRTGGVLTEAKMPFAALQRLIQPCVENMDTLALPQHAAIETAIGARSAEPPETFMIALAVLDLLSEAAAHAPLLVLVEDAHWLDDSTTDVLAFVARRVELEPLLMLLSAREGPLVRIDDARLPELALRGLDPPDAEQLLDEHAPRLAPAVRSRVLELAAGNPLALIELPRSRLDIPGGTADISLSERLERAFSERLAGLPEETRSALLVAALDEGGDVASALAAGALLDGGAGSIRAFTPAEEARLVALRGDAIHFRHPLVRAAVVATAATADRQAAHAALARAYVRDPDRSVWHEAASLHGPDESIALRLEAAAERAERRGAPALAAAALERAATLTPDQTLRGGRLVRAAEAELDLGRIDVAHDLLARTRTLDLDDDARTRVAFIREVTNPSSWTGADSAAAFAKVADDLAARGAGAAALQALQMVSLRLWWGNPHPDVRRAVVTAAERAADRPDDPLLLSVLALADPIGRGRFVKERLERFMPDPGDPVAMHHLGYAADATYSHDLALPFLTAAVEGFRPQGRLGLLCESLMSQAYSAIHLANAPLALSAAEEAERLARDTMRPLWAITARLARAIVAAERGQHELAESLATEAEAVLTPMGANALLGVIQFARGRGAVAHQLYEEGYFHLRRLFDSADVAYQPLVGLWGLSDLIESSFNTDRRDEAVDYLEQLEEVAEMSNGSLLHAELAYARPLLASDAEAGELYQAALEHGLVSWPCYRGRLLLNYGRWLRRRRRVAESRAPLRAARELFDSLGFVGLAEAARNELRASGETSRKRDVVQRDQLTPQELQIAQLAAGGMTNREIGSKLYLSHRTVGSHLYRLFPKLGVTSRSQLREALGEVE